MKTAFSKFFILSVLFSVASCGNKSELDICTEPQLTDLAIGDRVPETAQRKVRHMIMTSPGQFQPKWSYSECGVLYTLGVDDDGYVQFLSTDGVSTVQSDEIGIGTLYGQVKKSTGKTAIYYQGWLHMVELNEDWKAGFNLIEDELPEDIAVDILFKGNNAGYGRRNN